MSKEKNLIKIGQFYFTYDNYDENFVPEDRAKKCAAL